MKEQSQLIPWTHTLGMDRQLLRVDLTWNHKHTPGAFQHLGGAYQKHGENSIEFGKWIQT